MPRLKHSHYRILAPLLLLFALAAPLSAQGAPRAALAGWLQSLWTRATVPFEILWNDGRGGCDPNGGPCGEAQSS
jgi:hypothetical protein